MVLAKALLTWEDVVAELIFESRIRRGSAVDITKLATARNVTGNAEGLVSRGGLVWLAEAADLCGLTAGFDAAFAGLGGRRHRPGRTMAQMMLALADGATSLADIAVDLDPVAVVGSGRSGL